MSESNDLNSRREFIAKGGVAAGAAAIASVLGSGTVVAQDLPLNAMQPTQEQIQQFTQLPSGPVVMVNLLKFKPNGGAEEYAKYGAGIQPILENIGAELVFSGQCKMALLGGATWDAVGLVRYPDKTALLKMAQSPEYQAIHGHRDAGLEGQINLAVFETGGVFEQGSGESNDVTADQIMSRMDTNGDGKIDMDEAPEQLKGAFGMVDANGDGGIDLSEAQTIADFRNNQ